MWADNLDHNNSYTLAYRKYLEENKKSLGKETGGKGFSREKLSVKGVDIFQHPAAFELFRTALTSVHTGSCEGGDIHVAKLRANNSMRIQGRRKFEIKISIP